MKWVPLPACWACLLAARADPSLDELLVAALRQSNEGFAAVRDSGTLADPDADLAEELARLMGEWLSGERTGMELEYELYLAAVRRPALRPVAAE